MYTSVVEMHLKEVSSCCFFGDERVDQFHVLYTNIPLLDIRTQLVNTDFSGLA